MKSRIDYLVDHLNKCNSKYYKDSISIIPDREFDRLLQELKDLEHKYPHLKRPDSPSYRVGSDIVEEFETINHKYPMLSLDNTYTKEEIINFDKQCSKLLNKNTIEYVCEPKFDGVAISLVYKDGFLVKGITRGDGKKGDNVTSNIKTIKSIPLRISGDNIPSDIEVRGEVYISNDNFYKLNKNIQSENNLRLKNGKKPFSYYSNPRNTASGSLKMLDSSMVAKRNLDCYVYALYGEDY